MHSKPLVSIITPTFNSSKRIAETLKSVQSQDFGSWEHLIVDDASTDGTPELIKQHADSDPRIRCFYLKKNGGPARARNVAIEEARGRYIAFIDSDDLWEADKLSKQLSVFQMTDASLVYGAYYWLDEETGKRRSISVPETVTYAQLLNATVIATVTAMYDTERIGKVYMPELRQRQDYGLWLSILRNGDEARAVPTPVATLRRYKGSLSSNYLRSLWYTWRIYREVERLSLVRSCYHFVNYSTRAALKRMG